jgi:L-rhamnose mutarotase
MKAGEAIAYQKRHDESWPELVGLLHDTGISDYSIFLEEETHRLFAVLAAL